MFIHGPTLSKIVKTTFSPKHFSVRRASYAAAFGGIHAAVYSLTAASQGFDRLLYRDLAEQQSPDPLFIIATPRSGTTLTHRLMALDSERFTYHKLYQTVLPAVSAYRVMGSIEALSDRLGRPLAKLADRFEKSAFHRWEGIHQMGLTESEEDENFFVLTLLTPAVYLLVPFVDDIPHLAHVDEMPPELKTRLAEHYRSIIRRHDYAAGHGRIPLIKNVLLTGRLDIALEAFPNARFVHLVRHPYQAIPSALSLFFAAWEAHSPDISRDSPEVLALARLFASYYRELHQRKSQLPADRFVTVRYEDLIPNPIGTLERVYEQLGHSMSATFRAKLEAETTRQRTYKSGHKYTLEEFGLTKDLIYGELSDCFEAYGYER